MKLIVNLKLQPTPEQAKSLRQTLERANAACNWISEQGWQTQPQPTLKQFALHKLTYHEAKAKFDLTAQMVVRCISKVADAYKLDKKRQRTFKRHGSIAYDDRIIRFKTDDTVSLWTVAGRLVIPFVCGEYQRQLLPYRKGEIDLIYRQGNFYLNCVCDIEEPPESGFADALGVDFGIANITTTSDGEIMSGAKIEGQRRKMANRRQRLQRKGTKSAKRKLKQLAGRQARYQRDVNHCISKHLVLNAKGTSRALAVEDLTGIRDRVTVRKAQRAKHSNWSFHQLRGFLEYKAKRYGVAVLTVDPRNTSRACSRCGFTDKANRKSQDKFLCLECGYQTHADFNAALNIRARAMSTGQTITSVIKASSPAAQTQAAAL